MAWWRLHVIRYQVLHNSLLEISSNVSVPMPKEVPDRRDFLSMSTDRYFKSISYSVDTRRQQRSRNRDSDQTGLISGQNRQSHGSPWWEGGQSASPECPSQTSSLHETCGPHGVGIVFFGKIQHNQPVNYAWEEEQMNWAGNLVFTKILPKRIAKINPIEAFRIPRLRRALSWTIKPKVMAMIAPCTGDIRMRCLIVTNYSYH